MQNAFELFNIYCGRSYYYLPALFYDEIKLSPACRFKWSLIFLGMVVCPLTVIAALGIIVLLKSRQLARMMGGEIWLESEISGHVKGAFTGADREREGKFGLAGGGTILLDEIGDMPLELQPKLLRVLEEHTYEMLGSNRQYKADLRVIVATHRDLNKMVKERLFREDLFHRINIFPKVNRKMFYRRK